MLRRLALLCVALPFVLLLTNVSTPPSEHWEYVSSHMLTTYIRETAIVASGSVAIAAVLALTLAWCVGMYSFPGKRFFEIALFLPLAIPSYIAAYTYDGLLGYTGFVQATLRNHLDFNINSLGIAVPPMAYAIFVFAITLYPYIYMFVLAFLKNQSASLVENAILLGGGQARVFFRVMLPLLWPSLLAGGTLVFLEVLNDFGVTSHFGVHTFTTAIFSAWFGMGEVDSAIKLAVMLLAFVLAILLVCKFLQRGQKYHTVSSKEKWLHAKPLATAPALFVTALCLGATLIAFAIPVAQMAVWASLTWRDTLGPVLTSVWQTLYIGGLATAAIMILAAATANAGRAFRGKFSRLVSQGTSIGYAIPAAVLSIGVIMLFANVDKAAAWLYPIMKSKPISLTAAMLVYAYVVRFFSIGYQAVDNGYTKIGNIYTEASRTLGRGVTQTFFRVDLPLIRNAIISGSVLVFVDIIKELALTLTLRPFNFDTLGTKTYEYANNEAIPETSVPSLIIISISAAFILFMQLWNRERK